MRRTYNIIYRFFIFIAIIWISNSCAQQGGGNLVGGEKDESPPEILESTPENFSTNFTGQDFEFVFDEYFALKELEKKLIISPPMEEKPEIKVRGKKLLIHFITELLPDRTYTLNFGDALVDLNESNPLDNFMVVFSTGNTIDSLEMGGTVVDAFTGEPVEGVSVMLYAIPPSIPPTLGGKSSDEQSESETQGGDEGKTEEDSVKTQDERPKTEEGQEGKTSPLSQELASGGEGPGVRNETTDSLPLTELPLYLSRTNKEGQYHLKNLAGGEYKLFALLDGNNNYLFDQVTEQVAYVDTLVQGRYIVTRDTVTRDTLNIEDGRPMIEGDSVKTEDARPKTEEKELADSVTQEQEFTPLSQELASEGEGLGVRQNTLRLFLETPPKQYITTTERKQADKIFMTFNEALDTLDMKLLYADDVEGGYLFEWSETRDSLSCWLTDSLLSSRDSLVFTTGYFGYDSLEQSEWIMDTLRFKFRYSAAQQDEKNPMSLRANTGRSMELGKPLLLSTGLPYEYYDTSKIALYRVQDSLEFREEYRISPIQAIGNIPGIDTGLFAFTQASIDKVFLQDSSYSLRILPGAFTSYLGSTNDSLTVDFKVNNIEKYGSLIMTVENLAEPAILQLLNAKSEPIVERRIEGDAVETFALLKPGKYSFKMILDKNQNGKWDTGRYLKNIQPEEILLYQKEITLKANWEMEETWTLKPNTPN